MNDILKQLTEIDSELRKPFPTNDINKITEDFRTEFMKIPDEVDFYDDFHFYCMNIEITPLPGFLQTQKKPGYTCAHLFCACQVTMPHSLKFHIANSLIFNR